MSIDHSFEIGKDASTTVYLNISGLDHDAKLSDLLNANIYAFDTRTGSPRFTCSLSLENLAALYRHLATYSQIKNATNIAHGKFIEVAGDNQEILSLLTAASHESLIPALKNIVSRKLTNDDVSTILGRKDSLEEFEAMLMDSGSFTEPDWQRFFEANEWIFGYGLRYKYLKILQREAHISRTDLDGSNDVISDFLISDSRFTKLVELKTPSTPLFKNRRNRSDSWCLSGDVTDAVSQILSQKANWELEGASAANYTSDGKRITEVTHDVECILILGRQADIEGTDRERLMKRKTLELYRRNLRHIDIITFDELFDRAKYIVSSSNFGPPAESSS